MYEIKRTTKYKKDYNLMKKQGKDMTKLTDVITILANGQKLSKEYRDHKLIGNRKGFRECHIDPDWLLVYRIEKEQVVLVLCHTGSHSEVLDL